MTTHIKISYLIINSCENKLREQIREICTSYRKKKKKSS